MAVEIEHLEEGLVDFSIMTSEPRPRPELAKGKTHKVATGCGNLYVTINKDQQGICEIFTSMGRAGGCKAATSQALAKVISLALRAGVSPEILKNSIKGIQCPSPGFDKGETILSCPDAMARILEEELV